MPSSIDPTVGFSAVRRRYTLTQWFVFTWVIADFISLLIGSTISFIPTHLVELVLIVLGLAIGIVFLVRVTPSQDSPEWKQGEWDQTMKTLPPSLRRPAFYFVGTIMVAFLSAPNLYMVVLATHAAISRSVEITLSVAGTSQGLGVLGDALTLSPLWSARPFLCGTPAYRPRITKSLIMDHDFKCLAHNP